MTSVVFKLNRVRERLFQIGNLQWKLFHIALCFSPLNPDCFMTVGLLIGTVGIAPGFSIAKSNGPGVFLLCPDLRDVCFTHLVNNNRKNAVLFAQCFHEKALCN